MSAKTAALVMDGDSDGDGYRKALDTDSSADNSQILQYKPTNYLDTENRSELLDVPDLVRHKIMRYLKDEPFALLTLREVCSTTKQWVTEFRGQENAFKGFHATIVQEEEAGWNTLEAFLNMELYVSNFLLEIDDVESFFQNPSMPQFMKIYGPGIKKLKISNFNSCVLNCELDFYEALISLEEIELEEIVVPVKIATEESLPFNLPPRVPKTFENLKVLKLGEMYSENMLEASYIVKLIYGCPNLDVLWYPYLMPMTLDTSSADISEAEIQIMEYPIKRKNNHPGKPNLRCFNLKHFQEISVGYMAIFRTLVDFCSENDIKLHDVNSELLGRVMDSVTLTENPVLMDLFALNIAETVVSMFNMAPRVLCFDLPKLEKINIKSTAESSIDDSSQYEENSWNCLKTLKIHFETDFEDDKEDLENVIQWLVVWFPRPTCESLTLTWEWLQLDEYDNDCDFIKSRDIITNFANLKKLKVVNWNAKNRKFIRLWNGLHNLEELRIENCQVLGNVGFIGENPDDPIFLKLKGLKKLTLKLDRMTKVTDRCFRDVFRHLKLKEFNLISDRPLKSVTIKGIESLLDGEFASSIEKFPFKTWSLEGVSSDQHVELQKKFKCVRW